MKHANLPVFVPHEGCPHLCSFCDQRTISGRAAFPQPEEVAALCEHFLRQRKGVCAQIAFFGGSFTAIPRERMESLLRAAAPYVGQGGITGIRVSTRPDAVDEDVLELLRACGVQEIELGAQSMDDEVLALNGRGHTAAQVEEASRLIHQAGFSLGLQMMTGLYGDTPEKSRQTALRLAELSPRSVRIYPTAVLEGTRLAELYLAGKYRPPGVEESVPLCAELLEFFEGRGVPVIRLGLHDSPELRRRLMAGCAHPAFRELCENALYYRKISEALEGRERLGAYVVRVPKGAASKAAGQKRRNVLAFRSMGCRLKIVEDPALGPFEVRLERIETGSGERHCS